MKKAGLATLLLLITGAGVALALLLPSTLGAALPTSTVTVPILPTDKDQCKDGGWQSFHVFKNQGDCVSFVATQGKNPPG
jgi:hypothetical protein